ncbi:MAG TPA: alkaline phosphatase family protein, partial [Candidatus Dormibacteraeota bacterium]|nr:alkaline phosphatase family protein [Candidatus Dormibacteraeota bacterium]
RCGVPSTTPFAQAGILFGDNSEIPSYRWWDKDANLLVSFGSGSTFAKVAHKYFQGRTPLTEGGACIAALYRAGATDRFGPPYEERHKPDQKDAGGKAIAAFLLNPVTLYFWIRHGGLALFRIASEYLQARFTNKRTADVYVIADIYHEVLVHHLTRFALLQAIDENLPAIYACFYTYDEAAHAFGPTDPNTLKVLRHIDSTIRLASQRAKDGYDIVVLSDHGQVETTPFEVTHHRTFGAYISDLLPDFDVTEHRGHTFPARAAKSAGRVEITYSGGLAHVYFAGVGGRMDKDAIETMFPGLTDKIAAIDGVGMVLRKGQSIDPAGLAQYDDPEILASQLRRLNGFERSGDLVIFGAYDGQTQVNFEDQVGGHGSIGGDQLHPFLLAKKAWAWDTTKITNSSQLYPLLAALRG